MTKQPVFVQQGKEAEKMLQESTHMLKQTGAWSHTPASRETILFIDCGGFPIELSPKDGDRLVVVVAKDVETDIIERGDGGSYAIDVLLHENASIRYFGETKNSSHIRRFGFLNRDARLFWRDYAVGDVVDIVCTTYLGGIGAESGFKSCFLGKNQEKYSVKSTMIHAGDKSTSNMLTRAALLDESLGNSDGLIRILPNAKGCDAYQRGEGVLVSPMAKMHAQPNLEISNEDVKCSHGVSVAQIDSDQLFYFQARGIKKNEAVNLIVEGFFAHIIDEFPQAERIRREISARIAE